MANKQYITIHNMLQADSLVLASNLLVKRYEGTRLTLTQDEYDDDVLLYRRGEYEIVKDLSYFVSNPHNVVGDEKVEGAPYYDTTDKNYDGTKDSSNVSGGTRADGTPAVSPYYVNPEPSKYYFYKFQATKGGFVPAAGDTWKIVSSSGAIDGSQATLVGELNWYAPENANFDKTSNPESDTYSTTSTGAVGSETYYNPSHDCSNISGKKRYDGTDATNEDNFGTVVGYWDGGDYSPYLEEQFDNVLVKNLPVESEDDWKKSVVIHTNNALSIPVVLRLEDNRTPYEIGDTIYLKTSAGGVIPENPKKGVDFADTNVDDFTQSKTLVEADLKTLIHAPKVEPTEAKVVFDENSFHVDTAIIDMAWITR